MTREPTFECKHPPDRIYAWWATDGTLCAGCCDCGAVLSGAARGSDDDYRSESPPLKIFSERFPAAMSGLRDRLIEKGVEL